MEGSSVIVSVIGNYKGYSNAVYTFNGRECESTYSTVALSKLVGASHIIVFAPISIIAILSDNEEFDFSGNYDHIAGKLQTEVRTFISELMDKTNISSNTKLIIKVIPNIGAFNINASKTLKLTGNNDISQIAIYHYLIGALAEIGENNIKLYVDGTHAPNQLVLALVNASTLVARFLASADLSSTQQEHNSTPDAEGFYSKNDKLVSEIRVLSSDPYNKNSKLQFNEYSYELLKDQRLSTNLLMSQILPLAVQSDSTERVSNICSYINRINSNFKNQTFGVKFVRKTINAFDQGLLLLILSNNSLFKSITKELGVAIQKILEIHTIDYNSENSKYTINFVNKCNFDMCILHSFFGLISSNKFKNGSNVSLARLEELSKTLPQSLSILFKSELNKLRGLKNITKHKTLVSCLSQNHNALNISSPVINKCALDQRNFIAHGGFEMNVTYIWKDGNNINVSYGDCLSGINSEILALKND